MEWAASYAYAPHMGTKAYDDFAALWRGARHHAADESGNIVYQ